MFRIKRFNVVQTASMVAVIYFFVFLIIAIPVFLVMSVVGTAMGGDAGPFAAFSGVMILVMPFIYGVVGFIAAALFCLIYNLVAKWIGGIEVEVQNVEPSMPTATDAGVPPA